MDRPLVVRNLRQIVTVDPTCAPTLGTIENAALVCHGDRIAWVGAERELDAAILSSAEVIDGRGGVLTPGLVECHTHFLYAGSREAEFVQRVSGATFEEIARAGGGILSTVAATRTASADELMALGRARLDAFLAHGSTTVEVKSGYGLCHDAEMKMLTVMRELDRTHDVDLVATFMAAHAVPPEYRDRRQEYVALIAEGMIPEVAEQGLADFCDVFCDDIAFSAEETQTILDAAQRHGLKLKVHAEQFSLSGGTAAAVHFGACSVDHLDCITPQLIAELARSNVVAVLTPGVNLFLGLDRWPPARALLDAGIDVALSTDYSPGACMTENLALIMGIACMRMKIRPDEALRGATLMAARAIARDHDIGSITVGKRADAVVWSAPTYEHLTYHFGVDHVAMVIKNGRLVVQKEGSRCLSI